MLPLGAAWTGYCQATGGNLWEPNSPDAERLCNLGYARGVCARFPTDDAGADAVRFTLAADDGATLRLYYALERDHHPFAHGALEYSLATQSVTPPGSCAVAGAATLHVQAEAYAASYLRRKAEARPTAAASI